ncbi:MAG: hypothetical protein U0S48_22550 [Solirubrobacteraceae bacterium]
MLAFYAIAPTIVSREQLPAKGMAAGFSTIPATCSVVSPSIGRYGQGAGSQLLLDALDAIVEAADRGGVVIVVDAIGDAAVACSTSTTTSFASAIPAVWR